MEFDKSKFRGFFEKLVDEIYELGYKVTDDEEIDGNRHVVFEKYQLVITLKKLEDNIDFDIYADLRGGIYEIGDLHILTRKMMQVKKVCLKYNAREMNTTERLYPEDRQGKNTQTSGL